MKRLLRSPPRFLPPPLWQWLAGGFLTVGPAGDERPKEAPWFMPRRAWQLLSRWFFVVDIQKHKAFQRAAPLVLKEALSIAPDAWLFSGTLLGCIRGGAIIPWDVDIDLGFPGELMTDSLLDRFRAAGFEVQRVHRYELPEYREYVPEAMGHYSKIVLRKVAKVELYCFVRGRDDRLYYAEGKPRMLVIDRDLVYPQRQVLFHDVMANVPERAEEQLKYMYGEDWRTPKPRWIRTPEHQKCQERFFIELPRAFPLSRRRWQPRADRMGGLTRTP